METLPKVAVVIPKHYGVISRNHDRIHFPLLLLLMDLQNPWRKGVLYCSGYWDHLFVSHCQAYAWWAIVPQPSQPLTFGNVIFGCPASKFPGYVKKHAVWESGNFCMQHLSRYEGDGNGNITCKLYVATPVPNWLYKCVPLRLHTHLGSVVQSWVVLGLWFLGPCHRGLLLRRRQPSISQA